MILKLTALTELTEHRAAQDSSNRADRARNVYLRGINSVISSNCSKKAVS